MDTVTLSSRCISDYEVLQDQRQLPIALGWSLHSQEDDVRNRAFRKSGGIMDQTQPIWIRDPLSILADGAERGVVVRGGKIVELVPRGREPATANTAVYDASAHVVLPGLINTHHHFYQTLTRALPAALDRELFPWLQALYPVWARLTPESLHLGVTVAMSELLLSGRSMAADEALACGFYSRLLPVEELRAAAAQLAQELADGPTFAHGMTKAMLNQEWNMGLEQALEAEAQAQAICMKTDDFRRAYEAFSAKQRPAFKGD